MNYLKKTIDFIENRLEQTVQKCQEKAERLHKLIGAGY